MPATVSVTPLVLVTTTSTKRVLSYTKTSRLPLWSPATRFEASLSNTTAVPLALITGRSAAALPAVLSDATVRLTSLLIVESRS